MVQQKRFNYKHGLFIATMFFAVAYIISIIFGVTKVPGLDYGMAKFIVVYVPLISGGLNSVLGFVIGSKTNLFGD